MAVDIRVYCHADQTSQDDIVEIPDDEWNALTSDEREERLDCEAREFLGNCVDFGAHTIEEESHEDH